MFVWFDSENNCIRFAMHIVIGEKGKNAFKEKMLLGHCTHKINLLINNY